MSDRALVTAIGALLFLLAAWPILLVDVPPYQDLPGHMATATVVAERALYPEFVFNGFLKTNAALVAWLVFVGRVAGIKLAAKLYVLGAMAALSFVLPRAVLEWGGRRRMIVASAFMPPMIHNWWLSMGMINFALGVAIAIEILVQLQRQIRAASTMRAAWIVALSLALWYTHSIPLFVVCFLAFAYAALRRTWSERIDFGKRLFMPLLPGAALVVLVMVAHVAGTRTAAAGTVETVEFEPFVWTLYDLWAKWFYGFTEVSATSLVPAAVLAIVAARRWRDGGDLFSPAATLVLLLGLCLLPYVMPGFGYVNVRLVPFFWLAALARVPESLPRKLTVAVGAASIAAAIGTDVDLLRLDREMRDFGAGVDVVPERARLLSLNFARRMTSKNTWSLHTASGLYVISKHTSAQDLWADSPTMPVMHASPPDMLGDWIRIRRFTEAHASATDFCARERDNGLREEGCEARFADDWRALWTEAIPRFDHVILWQPSADVLATIPARYTRVLERRGLYVLARE